ncbi:hypothetical protein ACHAQA_004246 [Verticillium albo-atrum]
MSNQNIPPSLYRQAPQDSQSQGYRGFQGFQGFHNLPDSNNNRKTAASTTSSDIVPLEVVEYLAHEPVTAQSDDEGPTPTPSVRPDARSADPENLVYRRYTERPMGGGLHTRYPVLAGEIIFQDQQTLRGNGRSNIGMADAWIKTPIHDQGSLKRNFPGLRNLPRSFSSGAWSHNQAVRRVLTTHGFEYQGDSIVFKYGSKANHACPSGPDSHVESQINATMTPHASPTGTGIVARFTATRDIAANQEIFIDYQKPSLGFKCLCNVCRERRSRTWLYKMSAKVKNCSAKAKMGLKSAGHVSYTTLQRFGRWASAANRDLDA